MPDPAARLPCISEIVSLHDQSFVWSLRAAGNKFSNCCISATGEIIAFGPFRLNPAERLLTRNGVRVDFSRSRV